MAIHGQVWSTGDLWGSGNYLQMLIDGDKGTVLHGTEAPPDGFLYHIDLDKSYDIGQIKIYPRQDSCCPERLSNFRVSIFTTSGGNPVWSQEFFTDGSNAGNGPGALVTVDLPEPVTGQAVEIVALSSPVPDYSLQMTEVEILAEVPAADVNRAVGAVVTSNRPLWENRSPQVLADGNRSGRGVNLAHGLAEIDPGFAYELNLGIEVDISRIIIIPRQDACCPERLTYYRVSVHPDDGGAPGDAVWSAVLHDDFSFIPTEPGSREVIEGNLHPSGTFRGQWIRIESLEDPVSPYALQIGEVEVYGVRGSGVALVLNQEPADTVVGLGQTVTFTVGVNLINGDPDLLSFQWQKDGEDILGATETSYTTPALLADEAGATYRVIVSYPDQPSLTSREATVSVNLAFNAQAFSNRPLWSSWTIAQLVNGNRSDIVHGDVDIESGFAYEVRLLGEVELDRIDIYPRQDGCCPERFTNLRVSVHEEDDGAIGEAVWSTDLFTDETNPGSGLGGVVTLTAELDPDGSFQGQWIRILSLEDPVQNYALQMNELEVFGNLVDAVPQIIINQQPQVPSAAPYRSTTLSVAASVFNGDSALLAFQWSRNGTPISGATSATYTTGLLQPDDEGAKFRVTISYPGISPVESEEVTLAFDYNYARGALAYSNRPLYAGWNIAWLVDGNRLNVVHGDTSIQPGFAYTVDLLDEVDLDRIDIYPRQDTCCPDRFTYLRVSVHADNNGELGDEVWGVDLYTDFSNPGSGPGTLVSLAADLNPAGQFQGQWIRILSLEDPVQDYALQIAELEAIGRIEAPPAPLHITLTGTVLTWSDGTLESADDLTGVAWAVVEGATSPYTLPLAGDRKFYRLRR